MIKRLAGCVREYKKPTILTLIFIVGEAFIETFIPFITAKLVNLIKYNAPMEQVVRIGLFLVLMACLSLCCGGIAGATCAKASTGFARNLRHDMFERVQSFSFENIDRFSSASLVTRMTTDVSNVQMSFMMIIRMAIRCPLMFIFCIVMAFIMGGKLALTFVVVVPVLIFGLLMIARKAMPAFRAVFRKYDRLNESIEENVRAMRVVKGFAREDYEKQKFGAASEDICGDFTHAERIVALNSPLMQLCVYFNMVFIMIVGSKLVITSGGQTIDVGQMSAMLTYGFQILMSLMMISMIYVMLTMSAESAKRICEVLAEEPALSNPENPVTEVKDGSVDFDGVSFKYSAKAKKFALRDIDLHIAAGMTVGILGGTGSSKTTLIQLISRLYDTTEGSVRVGGVDVRDYDMETLRNSVAVVLQKNLLFSGTIKDNLRWGNPDATDEELVAACKLAQADDFVRSFPDSYDTWIEQGGTNVSGGQKQRLSIARAVYRHPEILIFDDSFSALDFKTDREVRDALAKEAKGSTKLIVAQRIGTIMNADRIIVLDDGKVVGQGTHQELLDTCDVYRQIAESQLSQSELTA